MAEETAEGREPPDPKGLIREAYRIEAITASECRSIFLDWALSLPEGHEVREAIAAHLALREAAFAEHPMTLVLRQGLEAAARPRRRGGWRSRPR